MHFLVLSRKIPAISSGVTLEAGLAQGQRQLLHPSRPVVAAAANPHYIYGYL